MRMVLVVVSLAAVALLTSAEVAQAGAVRQVFTYSSFPYTIRVTASWFLPPASLTW
jgi:hypothetical protein